MGFGLALGNGLAINLSTGKLGFGVGIGDSPFAVTPGPRSFDVEESAYDGTSRSATSKLLGDTPSEKPVVRETSARSFSPLELRLRESRPAPAGPRTRE